MWLLLLIRVAEWSPVWKRAVQFGLLCVCIVNVYQFACVLLSLNLNGSGEWDMGSWSFPFFLLWTSGPGCSKLKKCEKLLSFFSIKNFSVFGYKVVKYLTCWPLNELVKLTMLLTTGPWRTGYLMQQILKLFSSWLLFWGVWVHF